ncbi:SMC-Scp complex subunit ScpB [Thalassotalea sp. 1_MG-2023]|uniref:SMC-Scp complex subunit ScpB n=1 Tax=Thalassotalea sp. 1_MG-2023 TaxID=3062680 RepID=UPI0026E32B4D|nr:SMC-Scp complex subunit ScpB [Thalassotalea sp. 1_MG-2023]MDO6427297.1 SMC-Scp complex subunit ScpB [Thalassotalea sp. 1_MG-2023]
MNDATYLMSHSQLKCLIEAALFTADKPLSLKWLQNHTLADLHITNKVVKDILNELQHDYAQRGVHLIEVASGYRFQVPLELSEKIAQVAQSKPNKYSRALLETIALIAYRQPITRAEIEQVRGVAVSSQIIRTLTEREWITVVGQKEVPGKPSLYATTKQFLDYFSLSSLEQLPDLLPIADSAINRAGIQDIMHSHDTLTKETET